MRHLPLLWLLLAGSAHADSRVPAYVLQLPASISDIFIAETGKSTFYRYERTPSGIRLGNDGYMSIGENGAGKQRAWDRMTPLGIYFVVDRLDTSRMHERYGAAAFPLDYPNSWDRLELKSGYGIWLHGVAPGAANRPPLDTDGCLALPNSDLHAIAEKLVPLVTPVIVTREFRWQPEDTIDALRVELDNAVRRWASYAAAGDVNSYLSMYADDYTYRGMEHIEWRAFRRHSMQLRGAVEIRISELLLLADPEEENLFLSRFHQSIVNDASSSVTTKRLYWRRSPNGVWKIVAEDNG